MDVFVGTRYRIDVGPYIAVHVHVIPAAHPEQERSDIKFQIPTIMLDGRSPHIELTQVALAGMSEYITTVM